MAPVLEMALPSVMLPVSEDIDTWPLACTTPDVVMAMPVAASSVTAPPKLFSRLSRVS